jgi:biotin carboxyl carrier protein
VRKPTKRYYATLRGAKEAERLEVTETGPGRWRVALRGKVWDLDAVSLPSGALSLLVGGESYDVAVHDAGDRLDVSLRGHSESLEVLDESRMRLRSSKTKAVAAGPQAVSTPMPGKVVRVLVKAGDEVKEGQGLVVVEAMKMENELKSPKDGRVSEVLVREGQTVEGGGRLVVVA